MKVLNLCTPEANKEVIKTIIKKKKLKEVRQRHTGANWKDSQRPNAEQCEQLHKYSNIRLQPKVGTVQLLNPVRLCSPMDCSTQGFPVLHQLPEFTQTHIHWVSDAMQPSHPLSSPSPPALNLSQHQGLFQWVGSSNHGAKVLEFQPQHQSFQWMFRMDFL